MLKPIPHLRHLSMLLKRLPPVQISNSWTPFTTQHIPLRLALCTSDTENSSVQDLPWHSTVGVILQHLPRTDTFYPRHIRKNQRLLGKVIEALRVGKVRWIPLLQQQTNMLVPRAKPITATVPQWSTSWKWHISKDMAPLVFRCSPSLIRHQWQRAKPSPRPLPIPPFAYLPVDRMNRSQWHTFWSLKVPHNIRSVWWRLLLARLPTRSHLHKILPEQCPLPLCPICLAEEEDAVHMMISCPKKKEVWKAGQAMLGTKILDPYLVWQALTFQSVPRSKKKQQEWIPTLIRYGRILQVIWSCHWNVVFEEISWSHATAMQ
ncbi:hypothetical protein, partial, partial [Absidia glauca]